MVDEKKVGLKHYRMARIDAENVLVLAHSVPTVSAWDKGFLSSTLYNLEPCS